MMIRFAASEPKPSHMLLAWTPETVEHWNFSEKALPFVKEFLSKTTTQLPWSSTELLSNNTLSIEGNCHWQGESEVSIKEVLLQFVKFIGEVEGRLRRAITGDLGPVKKAWSM